MLYFMSINALNCHSKPCKLLYFSLGIKDYVYVGIMHRKKVYCLIRVCFICRMFFNSSPGLNGLKYKFTRRSMYLCLLSMSNLCYRDPRYSRYGICQGQGHYQIQVLLSPSHFFSRLWQDCDFHKPEISF